MSLLSIDVGTAHISVVEGTAHKNAVEIAQAIVVEMPKSGESDVKSAAVGPSDVIRGLLLNFGFKTKKAVVTVNINNMLIRDFTVPDAPPKQLAGMVRNEMVQNYSAAAIDVINFIKRPFTATDFEDRRADSGSSDESDAKGDKKSPRESFTGIRAVTVKRDVIDTYHRMLKSLKLVPVAMDFHANAVEKLISGGVSVNNTSLGGKNYLLVDFGSTGTIIHAVADNRVFFSRYIPLGTSDLDNIVAEREFTGIDQAKEFRLNKLNLLDEEDKFNASMQAARTLLYQWSDEIQKIMKFFLARRNIKSIDQIFLYGAGSLIKGLPDYVSASIGVETSTVKSISSVSFKNSADAEKLYNCVNAAGAVIRLK